MGGFSWGLGLDAARPAGAAPAPPVLVARHAVVMNGPQSTTGALLTGDGTEKTFTVDLVNMSGAAIGTMSLVLAGWQVRNDGAAAQDQDVGNSTVLTSATLEYPVGAASPAALNVGTIPNGGLFAGSGAATGAHAVPHGGTFRLTLKATPANGAKYLGNFGLASVRTHAMNNTINPAGGSAGDSLSTTDGSYILSAAVDTLPWLHQSVTGNKGEKCAAAAAKYAALHAAAGTGYFFYLFGTNDNSTRTAAQMAGYVQTIASAMAGAGVAATYAHTIPPGTTSPGGTWGPGDQVVTAGESNRVAYNALVRGTLSGAIRCFELADAVETARDSGFWKFGAADSPHLVSEQTVTASSVSSTTVMNCADMTLPSAVTASAAIVCVTGANAGTARTVSNTSGSQVTTNAWPVQPGIGDTFTIRPIPRSAQSGDGVHFGVPFSGGLRYGGWNLAFNAIKAVMHAIMAAHGKAPHPQFGAIDAGALNGTAGSATVFYPANTQIGDLVCLAVEGANQLLPDPAGMATVASYGFGAAAAAGAVSVQLLARTALYAAGDANLSVNATGLNHATYKVFTLRRTKAGAGCVHAMASRTDNPGTTAVTFPDLLTTKDGLLILNLGADETDSAAARVSGGANAGLIGLTERIDGGNVTGNGGGLFLWSGLQPAKGQTGATSAASTTTTDRALLTIAVDKGG